MVPVPDCQAVYESSSSFKNQFPGGFADKKLCAGEEEGGKDACQVSDLPDGRWSDPAVVAQSQFEIIDCFCLLGRYVELRGALVVS